MPLHRASVPISLALLHGAVAAAEPAPTPPVSDGAPTQNGPEFARQVVSTSKTTRRIPRITTSALPKLVTTQIPRIATSQMRTFSESEIAAQVEAIQAPAAQAQAVAATAHAAAKADSGEATTQQASTTSAAAAPKSQIAKTHTIFLNHGGTMLKPGYNNSIAHTSSLVSRPTQVPGWKATPEQWEETMACMKDIWSRFDVTITDQDPGAEPHMEAVFAKSPVDLGMTSLLGGVSPFADNCSTIENSVVFAFADNLGNDPETMCETMSQEIAHSYGLDHEMVAADPMSYLPYNGPRGFQDVDAQCGEFSARPCGLGGNTCGTTQNSVKLLMERLGPANRDRTLPSVAIAQPAEADNVEAGFNVAAQASDPVGLSSVAFYVDGELVATQTEAQGNYQLVTDPDLEAGPHTITVEVTDKAGNVSTTDRNITVTPHASSAAGGGCSAGGTSGSGLAALFFAGLFARRRRRASKTSKLNLGRRRSNRPTA